MNGSGKSGIVTSVEILRNLIIDTGYLNNPVAQKHLDAIVNKKVGELSIEAELSQRVVHSCFFFSMESPCLKIRQVNLQYHTNV